MTYLRPYSEGSVTIETWNTDRNSPRYGMPETYNIKTAGQDSDDFPGSGTLVVHHTRTIHLAENKLDSEIFGTPRLKGIFNQLDNDMKVVGGGAEATWLNMRPGIAVGPKEGYDIDESETGKQAFLDEIERYLHDQARVLRAGGMDVTPVARAR